MNTKQLYYALKLSESLNFSQVAEQLNISQPALSKQILSLEKDLGVKLFDRSTIPMTLTPAGEHFIREAEELLYKEDQLLHSMERFKSGDKGRLTIGISPFRSQYLLPPIIKKFHEQFPGVQIVLRENASDILRKEAAEGKYDFAIVNLPVDESVLNVTALEPDTLVLAVPNNLANAVPHESTSSLPQIRLEDCSQLPFVVVGQTQEMRTLFEKLCTQANFHPEIVMEVVGLTTAWSMVQSGIGATLLPLQFAHNQVFHTNIKLFTLKNINYFRQPAIVTRRDQYHSNYAKYAIDLLSGQVKKP